LSPTSQAKDDKNEKRFFSYEPTVVSDPQSPWKVRQFPDAKKDVLKQWFVANCQYPYPSHEEKQRLSELSGLTEQQVSDWFSNARRRVLPKMKMPKNAKYSPARSKGINNSSSSSKGIQKHHNFETLRYHHHQQPPHYHHNQPTTLPLQPLQPLQSQIQPQPPQQQLKQDQMRYQQDNKSPALNKQDP